MTTFNWIIEQLERNISDGFVTHAHWRCNAVDGEFESSVYGSLKLERGDTFTPYENLTQDQVIGWVKNNLDVSGIESGAQTVIDAKKSPVTGSGVPWQ
jgi:hypothetical protein